MPAMPLAPDLEHDPSLLPSISDPSATDTGIGRRSSKAECLTASELSLPRALNSLLPPSLKAAEIRSFKSQPELGQNFRTGTCTGSGDNKSPTLADNPKKGNGNGLGGIMTSLQLFNATHLPPRETIRRLTTRLNTCLGITFFIIESSAEVEKLVDRVYSYCDDYHAARQKRKSEDATSGDVYATENGSGSALTKTTIASERSPQPPTTGEICEILAMAAVGAQYDQQAPASLRQACFHSARFGLDDAIEEAEETDAPDDACYRVLRLLALLAVYQILEKRGSCWRYIGTALNIAKAKGLDQYDGLENDSPVEGSLASQHMGMRKMWGTLICLESWLAATLGKPLTTQINLMERIKIGDPIFCCREDSSYLALHSAEGSLATRSLQTALVRIAILTAAIQRFIYPSARAGGKVNDPVDLVQARMHMADLNQWFETLPSTLHLSVLLREDAPPVAASANVRAIAFAERSSMLLGHCLYLSAIMLLTRRIFLSVVNDPDGGYDTLHRKGDTTNLPSQKKEALDFVSSCLMAANVMGRIMGLMVSEERLVSKCWMAIYPAFNASLLLLFHLTQRKLLRGETVEGTSFAPGSGPPREEDDAETVETMESAKKCLSALEFCAAGGDELSKWYLQVLAPFRKVLGGESERDIRKSVESIKGDMGQPGFNSVMEEVTSYPLFSPAEAYNPHDDTAPPSQPGRLPTMAALTAATPPFSTHARPPRMPYREDTTTSANQSANTNPTDDPALLSSHIYNILTVSAQCAFRPEDVSKVAISATESSGSQGHSFPPPPPAPPCGNVRTSDGESSTPSSSDSIFTAISSGTPSSSPPPASSSVEAPSRTLHPNTADAHPLTRLARAYSQEHEGVRTCKRASEQQLQSPQPGGEHAHGGGGGGVKRMKMNAYTALGLGADGRSPSQADLIALLRRAV